MDYLKKNEPSPMQKTKKKFVSIRLTGFIDSEGQFQNYLILIKSNVQNTTSY